MGARLDAIAELHQPSVFAALCRECMTEHPCRTARAAAGIEP